jgi:hypothetical protein
MRRRIPSQSLPSIWSGGSCPLEIGFVLHTGEIDQNHHNPFPIKELTSTWDASIGFVLHSRPPGNWLCFAGSVLCCPPGLLACSCHCEERTDEAISVLEIGFVLRNRLIPSRRAGARGFVRVSPAGEDACFPDPDQTFQITRISYEMREARTPNLETQDGTRTSVPKAQIGRAHV